MPSQSARATSLAESRYRIRFPNSAPRRIMVVGVDRPAVRLVEELAGARWSGAEFYVASGVASDPAHPITVPRGTPVPGGPAGGERGPARSIAEWFADVTGHTADLLAAIDRADVVFLIATAGEQTHLASLIGEACGSRHVKTSGLIVQPAGVPDRALSDALLALRPFVSTLGVVATGEDAMEMLQALGA